jgi:hypothetical protein
MQPRHADASSRPDPAHIGTESLDRRHNLMPRNDVGFANGQLPFHHVKIGAADATSVNPEQHLAGTGLGDRNINPFERARRGGRR